MAMKYSKLLTFILAFLFILISNIVSCRPSTTSSGTTPLIPSSIEFDSEGLDKRYKPCLWDEDLNELCERCMRVAEVHGDDIFAMCCVNEDGAQNFCRNYVYYGIIND